MRFLGSYVISVNTRSKTINVKSITLFLQCLSVIPATPEKERIRVEYGVSSSHPGFSMSVISHVFIIIIIYTFLCIIETSQ